MSLFRRFLDWLFRMNEPHEDDRDFRREEAIDAMAEKYAKNIDLVASAMTDEEAAFFYDCLREKLPRLGVLARKTD